MHYGVGGNGALGGGFVDNKGSKIFSRLVTGEGALFRGSAKLLNSFKNNFESRSRKRNRALIRFRKPSEPRQALLLKHRARDPPET